MEFNSEVFCKNLRNLREAKGYNKYEMSIQADIHYTYYLDIENGNLTPNFRGLISIANALNTDIAHLFGEKQYSEIDDIKNEITLKLRKVSDDDFLLKLYNILISIRLWSEDNHERL